MRHPTEGVLRRLVDEPAGVAEADRRHVADCDACLDDLATARADARLVGGALSDDSAPVDVDAAWQRLSATTALPADVPVLPRTGRAGRTRSLLRRPAVAAMAVAVVVAGAGTAAASGWLQIFRTEQVAPVSLRAADLVALPDLSAYGELSFAELPDIDEVADVAAAEAATGLDVPEVADLPRGVTGDPVLQAGQQVEATFTFSAERAAAAAAEAGEELPPVPPGLDGAQVRLVAGPGVVQYWSSDAGLPALVVGRATAPTAFSSGVPFETVRDYVLSLPGLPDAVADQLRTFTADGSTLPLPVPADEVTTSETEVDGEPATLIETRDRTLTAVVWVADGVVTVVGGSLDEDEVLEVAEGLR